METIRFLKIPNENITVIEYGGKALLLFNMKGPLLLDRGEQPFYMKKSSQFTPSLEERKILTKELGYYIQHSLQDDIHRILRDNLDSNFKKIIFDGDYSL